MVECRQRILVTALPGSSRAQITCLARSAPHEPWQTVAEYAGWVGKNGIRANRKTGDLTTPAGEFPLTLCFGCGEKPPGLQMPWRTVTPHSHWVGDPQSPLFNTWQEAIGKPDWDTAPGEWLADYPEEYEWACVIGFNPPPADPSAGFAIFFHVSESPTAGCVGLPKEALCSVLQWLDPDADPRIQIT